MRMEQVNARKEYIQTIRKSFDEPNRNYEWEKESVTKEEKTDSFPFFKLRIGLAILLFAVYIFCDITNNRFYRYTTKEVAQKIAQEDDFMLYLQEMKNTIHKGMEENEEISLK